MAAPAAETLELVSAEVIGNAFVKQYYHILHHSPEYVHKFYQDISVVGRPEEDGSMSFTTTMENINKKIISLNYREFVAEIKSVDSQESFHGGVDVLVTGYLTGRDHKVSHFTQSFFLAPQDKGYFVLNDMFRYVNNVVVTQVLVPDVVVPVLEEPSDLIVQSTPFAEEAVSGEVYDPPENGGVPVTEEEKEEVPVPEVVDEAWGDTQTVVEAPAKVDEAPKKSYASIVMHLKETAATFSRPPAAVRKAPPKSLDQVKPNPIPIPTPDGPVSSLDSFDHDAADGFSVYIKGLPMSATEALLGDIFNKFGTITNNGIQVRSNKQQGFCFGFVEFEDAASMQKAIEASPVTIGGRQTIVEEKRSTNSRGSNRGRFQSGRGSGFRNEGVRGRGGYGGGRGNNKGDFNGRSEFGSRGGNRGGSSNRDGYQTSESFNSNGGGRSNRAAGLTNGNTKNVAPHVSATA
ncbi:myosin ATPase [Salvia divinorum]|uniref:Myosin ATPase n=1 Tax=Salvia divinorum TaxID=28513 RepID=A0ABD1IAJ5_SALDI